jgi:hypothetical protein
LLFIEKANVPDLTAGLAHCMMLTEEEIQNERPAITGTDYF